MASPYHSNPKVKDQNKHQVMMDDSALSGEGCQEWKAMVNQTTVPPPMTVEIQPRRDKPPTDMVRQDWPPSSLNQQREDLVLPIGLPFRMHVALQAEYNFAPRF
jgi:hypothetical protein